MVGFFRHCPSCGLRFHVRLENKKMTRDEKRTIPRKRYKHTSGRRGFSLPVPSVVLVEGKPIIVEEKEFEYSYKCGHCGHGWTEKHFEEHREK